MNTEDQTALYRLVELSCVAEVGSDLARIWGVKQIPLVDLSRVLRDGGHLVHFHLADGFNAPFLPAGVPDAVRSAGRAMRAAGATTEALDDLRSGEVLRALKSPITAVCALDEWARAAILAITGERRGLFRLPKSR